MANKQIPQLPPVIALNGTEEIEGVQAGVSSRFSISQVFAYFQSLPNQQLSFTTPLQRVDNVVSLTTVPVAKGGTGAISLTSFGVLYGNSTSPVGAVAAGASNQVLTGNTGGPPTWRTLTTLATTSFSAGATGLTPSTATTGAIVLGGTLNLLSGGTGANLSATGGPNQVLRQLTPGGVVSVGQLTAANISGLPTALPPSGGAAGDLAGSYPSPTIKASVNLTGNPTVAGTLAVGGAVSAVGGTFTSSVALTGGLLHIDRFGAGADANLTLTADNAFGTQINFRSATLQRWQIAKNGAGESGGNSGSNFVINAYADNETLLGTALTITRATRAVALTGALTGTSATMTGAVSTGALSSTTGAFSGNLTGTTATFSGLVNALTPPTVDSTTKVATTAWIAAQGFTGGAGIYVRLIGDTMSGPLAGTTSTWSGLSTAAGFVSSIDTGNFALSLGRLSAGFARAGFNTRGDYGYGFQVNGTSVFNLDLATAAFLGNLTVAGTTALSGTLTGTGIGNWLFNANAGNVVYLLRLANNSTVAGTGTALVFDPTGNGVGVRDAQIRATANGTAITLDFLTSNGAPPVMGISLKPTLEVVFSGMITGQQSIAAGVGSNIFWTGRSVMSSPGDGLIHLANNTASAGVRVDLTTNNTLRVLSLGGADSSTLRANTGLFSNVSAATATYSGTVNAATFNATTGSVAYLIGGTAALIRGTYVSIYDAKNVASLVLGYAGDQQNYYRQDVHRFQHADGATDYMTIGPGASGVTRALHPPANSNDLNVATTAWVRTNFGPGSSFSGALTAADSTLTPSGSNNIGGYAESYDPSGAFDEASGAWAPTVAGVYRVAGYCTMLVDSGLSVMRLQLSKFAGSATGTYAVADAAAPGSPITSTATFSLLVRVASGDAFRLVVTNLSSSSGAHYYGSNIYTGFSADYVGP